MDGLVAGVVAGVVVDAVTSVDTAAVGATGSVGAVSVDVGSVVAGSVVAASSELLHEATTNDTVPARNMRREMGCIRSV